MRLLLPLLTIRIGAKLVVRFDISTGQKREVDRLEQIVRSGRWSQLTLFDVFLSVIQPAALILIGAAVVNLDNVVYVALLILAVVVLVFVQYSVSLRSQSDRTRELFDDYLQNRSNLLTVLTALATHSRGIGNLTKMRLLGAVETWFEEDLLHDYYWEQDIKARANPGMRFRQKSLLKRWGRHPGKELTYTWNRMNARLRKQPSLGLIDMVFLTPNEDIVSLVIARGLEEGFISEIMIAGEIPSDARIEYAWTSTIVKSP